MGVKHAIKGVEEPLVFGACADREAEMGGALEAFKAPAEAYQNAEFTERVGDDFCVCRGAFEQQKIGVGILSFEAGQAVEGLCEIGSYVAELA